VGDKRRFLKVALISMLFLAVMGEVKMAVGTDCWLREKYEAWKSEMSNSRKWQYWLNKGEYMGWTEGHVLSGLIYGFLAFNETGWLDEFIYQFDRCIEQLERKYDGRLGWYDENGVDAIVGEGLLFNPALLFIETVKDNQALYEKYGAKAEEYLQLIESMIPKWDERGLWIEIGEDCGVYVFQNISVLGRDQGVSLPYNKLLEYGRALLALYRITGKTYYLDKAVRLGNLFKKNLKLVGDHYEWNYWDPQGDWDYYDPPYNTLPKRWINVEHRGGYTLIDIKFVIEAYKMGIIFNETDLERFLNTQLKVMWNGDYENPKFLAVNGKDPSTWTKQARPHLVWSPMAEFNMTIMRIWDNVIRTLDPTSWQAIVDIPYYAWIKKMTGGNIPPEASFTYSGPLLVGKAVTFDASSSNDECDDGTIVDYDWDFGDGTKGRGRIVTHIFTSEGTYNVKLTVTDNRGGTHSVTHKINIVAPFPQHLYFLAAIILIIIASLLIFWKQRRGKNA